MTTDPLLEVDPNQLLEDGKGTYLGASPYNYVFNNPIKLYDPNGKEACCLDVVADIGFIGYDIYDLARSALSGEGELH